MFSEITHKFDLKGSMIKRKVLSDKQREKASYYCSVKSVILKDQDFKFLKCMTNNGLVNISLEDRYQIMKSIKADVEFLAKNNIMDYSLLFAIEDVRLS